MMTISKDWQRIVDWLGKNAPEIKSKLQPGATADEIVEAETAISSKFPDDLKALLSLVNGSQEWSVFGKWQLNSTEIIVSEHEVNMEVQEDLDDDDEPFWQEGYIPVLSDGGGNSMALDIGNGNFFEVTHDGEPCDSFASLSEAIACFANGLEAGQFRLDDGCLRRGDGQGYGFQVRIVS